MHVLEFYLQTIATLLEEVQPNLSLMKQVIVQMVQILKEIHILCICIMHKIYGLVGYSLIVEQKTYDVHI